MRLWIRSDLHCDTLAEVASSMSDPPAHDVAILAGDVGYGIARVVQALDAAAERPVVCVAGNHEFYRRTLDAEIDRGREASRQSSTVHFLQNAVWVHGGVRFVGATLWTDFGLHGAGERDRAMRYAAGHSADHDLILMREKSPLDLSHRSHVFQPRDAVGLHLETTAWLETVFATPHAGPTVVVTHHAPAPGSVSPEYAGDAMTPAYVSDLTARIERWQPELWIHGHTHRFFDYRVGRTRVLCNPRGLWGGVDHEDTGYDLRLVVDV